MAMSLSYGNVSGLVTVNDTPLQNAGIYLFDETQAYVETSTDSSGTFDFTDLEDRWYRLLVVSPVNSNGIPAFYPDKLDYCDGMRIWGGEDHQLTVPLALGMTIETNLYNELTPLENVLITA